MRHYAPCFCARFSACPFFRQSCSRNNARPIFRTFRASDVTWNGNYVFFLIQNVRDGEFISEIVAKHRPITVRHLLWGGISALVLLNVSSGAAIADDQATFSIERGGQFGRNAQKQHARILAGDSAFEMVNDAGVGTQGRGQPRPSAMVFVSMASHLPPPNSLAPGKRDSGRIRLKGLRNS